MARTIDYYFSFQSPWAYIGHDAFMRVVSAHGIQLNYKPFGLLNLFSETGGLPLGKRHPLRQQYRMIELQRWREKRGLSFHLRPQFWPVNPRLADGVAIAIVQSGGNPEPFMRKAYAGVWENQLDLADAVVVENLADEVGLAGAQLIETSGSQTIETIYEQNRQDAMASGVFGSPGYVLDGETFWGQDRIEMLDEALTSGRAPYRADV